MILGLLNARRPRESQCIQIIAQIGKRLFVQEPGQIIGRERHQLTAPDTDELLSRAGEADLDDWQRANLREMDRRYRHASAVPNDLVEAFAKACSRCEHHWRTARAESDFSAISGQLEEVVSLVRKIARARGEALGLTPYEALLDEYVDVGD